MAGGKSNTVDADTWQPGLPALLSAVLIAGWTPFSRLAIKQTGAGYIDSAGPWVRGHTQ